MYALTVDDLWAGWRSIAAFDGDGVCDGPGVVIGHRVKAGMDLGLTFTALPCKL